LKTRGDFSDFITIGVKCVFLNYILKISKIIENVKLLSIYFWIFFDG
jgi:hypothetical protein